MTKTKILLLVHTLIVKGVTRKLFRLTPFPFRMILKRFYKLIREEKNLPWLIKSIETEFVNKVVEEARHDAVILDVGCGDSYWAKTWVDKGRYVVPLDSAKCNFQKLPYVKADIRASPFKDKCCDIISCVCTIEHIGTIGSFPPRGETEDFNAMREMRRILKDDGFLILTTSIGIGFFDVNFADRVYSQERLLSLLDRWKVLRAETYGNFGQGWNRPTWKPATWYEIMQIPEKVGKQLNDYYGNVCLVLKK